MKSFFFFNDTATTEIYTLSLHDALPIFAERHGRARHPGQVQAQARGHPLGRHRRREGRLGRRRRSRTRGCPRSEEHTSELQSRQYLVCRLLLEKKNISNRSALSRRIRAI